MTNSDIQQAKEWAKMIQDAAHRGGVVSPTIENAAEVIQSLPDHIIDADDLREVINSQLSSHPHGTVGHHVAEELACKLQSLLDPPLPTLADMTPEERGTQKWMQAKVFPTASTLGIITGVDEYSHSAIILFADGMAKKVPWEDITPLPDLPKLEWPGSAPDDVAYATGGALTTQDVVDECRAVRKERALPRPEDVPAGEPWLVEYDGIRHVGAREKGAVTYLDWALARLDGTECVAARDREITLISRLVPEVGA